MSHNTLIHRSVRIVVGPLASIGITPNQVTTARLLSGIAAAGCYALGDAAGVYWGSALLIFSIALDRVDGELARATGRITQWGHKYDLWSDATVNALVFLGVGLGLRESLLGGWAIGLGALAAIAVAAVLALVVRVEHLHGPRAAEVPLAQHIDPDDAMLLAPVAMLLGAAPILLIAAALLAPIACLGLVYHFRQLLRAARARPQPRE